MESQFDGYIRKAIADEVDSHEFKTSKEVWVRIEASLKAQASKPRRNLWKNKIAMLLIALFIAGLLIAAPRQGATFPFGNFFRNLFDHFSQGTQRNVQYSPPPGIPAHS